MQSHILEPSTDIRYHFIRERILMSEIEAKYVSTKEMLADIFTKQLPRDLFQRFRSALGVGATQ